MDEPVLVAFAEFVQGFWSVESAGVLFALFFDPRDFSRIMKDKAALHMHASTWLKRQLHKLKDMVHNSGLVVHLLLTSRQRAAHFASVVQRLACRRRLRNSSSARIFVRSSVMPNNNITESRFSILDPTWYAICTGH